ncbi:PAB-dependent poly(A)-specific ribonuclease subunit PAN2 [Smittium culicis]|uniref:PAB-dependent poly(A)-specific ribonuclease subunit PAN2 n=1 Tax=Smittium culicis TaxID=133412 RepID=A0A1R1XLS2_9FUNG|nr:PAB-dependent poly(A)-specific ribonuclease subunit PAN2 [Smittium culicis]
MDLGVLKEIFSADSSGNYTRSTGDKGVQGAGRGVKGKHSVSKAASFHDSPKKRSKKTAEKKYKVVGLSDNELSQILAMKDPKVAESKKFVVAIDAEFVMLADEEAEFHSSGKMSMYRPRLLSLARISLVRGDGELKGVPFIDDYILTTHPVVDYVSEFSGIHGKLFFLYIQI